MSPALAGDTLLFLSDKSGLGNRLRALIGYEALSRVRRCRFCVCWIPDVACEAEFTELFEPPGFTLVSGDESRALRASETTCTYTDRTWFHDIWREHAPDVPWMTFLKEVRASLDRLTPIADIRDAVISFRAAHQLSDALGVHIRHTDNVEVYARRPPTSVGVDPRRLSRVEGFVQVIGAHIATMPVFLATDNPAIERMCRAQFGESLVTYPKRYTTEWSRAEDAGLPRPGPVRTSAVRDGLLEMLLLASCRRIVGTYYSSFSKFAAVWGGVDYLEMAGDVPAPHPTTDTTLAEFRSMGLTRPIF
jgi:hypothetical protein